MRVLFLATAFPRHREDVITPWLVEAVRQLRARGVEVEVLAPAYRGLGDQVVDSVPVHRFRYAPTRVEALTHDQTTPDRLRESPASWALVPGYLAAGAVAAVRLSRGFDVLHAFWPLPHTLMALPAKRLTGIPIVSTFFGAELRWKSPLRRALLRRAVAGSDAITAISSDTAAELRALVPGANAEVIPFGGVVVPPSGSASEVRGDRFRLLFLGRLVERKGVPVLLEALRSLGPGVELDVVGDGPMRAALEAKVFALGVGERVRFHGFVSAEEKARLLSGCDALVLPAVTDAKGDTEGLGVVLLEAMALGKPVVASRVGGIVDVVEHERNGLLCAPGDASELARAVERLRAAPALRERLGAAARDTVVQRFSWASITGKLVRVYESVRR